MHAQHSQNDRSQPLRWRSASLLLVAALLLGVAAPAQAGDEFEDAFQATLGGLLAYEAVQAGRALLTYGALPYPAPVAYPAPAYAVPVPVPVAVPAPYAYPVPVPAYAVVYRGHGPKYHGHGRGHGHGWRDCD